jgi:hypothetical protein
MKISVPSDVKRYRSTNVSNKDSASFFREQDNRNRKPFAEAEEF